MKKNTFYAILIVFTFLALSARSYGQITHENNKTIECFVDMKANPSILVDNTKWYQKFGPEKDGWLFNRPVSLEESNPFGLKVMSKKVYTGQVQHIDIMAGNNIFETQGLPPMHKMAGYSLLYEW